MLKKLTSPRNSFVVLAAILMTLLIPSFMQIGNIFRTEGFDPHGHCFLWKSDVLRLYVVSDTVIGLSYISISFTLVLLVYRLRSDIPFPRVFLAFGVFIVSCGLTHFLDIWTLWNPTYYFSGYMKFITALASAGTAFMLPAYLPRTQRLVNDAKISRQRQQALKQAVGELEMEIAERQKVLAQLKESEEKLRKVVDNAPVIFSTINRDGVIEMMEGRGMERLTTPREQIVGANIYALNGEASPVSEAVKKTFIGQETQTIYVTNELVLDMRFTPVKNDEDEVVQVISVATDITERYRTRQELEKSYDKERELTQLQRRFITTMSHEFRTPLTIINTSAQLLNEYFDRLTEERRNQHLLKMQVQIKHITEMLDDILTTGQFEAERIPFNPSAIDLNAFCMEVINDLQHTASKHELILRAEDNPCTEVILDQKLTTRIVYNLLSNAIKYSPDGGAITLSLNCDDDTITLKVQDEGIGMSDGDCKNVFERFHRGDNISNISGTGLGMYIVKQAVDLHGGTIDVRSELGAGTTITINMPRQR